jgi:hypothetical protein
VATFTKTVDPNGGSDYLSLSAWQAGEKSLYSSGDIAVAVCKRTGATKDTTAVTITGWTAGVVPKITVDPAYKHEGKWADTRASDGHHVYILTGSAGFTGMLTAATVNAEINDLLIENTSASSGRAINLTATGTVTVRRCLVKASAGGGIGIGAANFGTGPYNIWNCVAYLCATGFQDGRGDGNAARYIRLENCTAYGCTTTGISGGFGTVINNCISVASTTSDFARSSATPGGDFNASSDATAFGAHVVTGKTSYASYFVSAAAGDLHLLGASSSVLGLAGADLSVRFTDDIDQNTRSAWDLGVDEYVAGGGGGGPQALAGSAAGTVAVTAGLTITSALVGSTAGAATVSGSLTDTPAGGGVGNHLTAQQASAEDGTLTGFSYDNTVVTVTNSNAVASNGTHSIALTSIDTTSFPSVRVAPTLSDPGVAVTPGNVYTGMVEVRAGAAARLIHLSLTFFTSGHSSLGANSVTVTDTASGWTQLRVVATAPPTAATGRLDVFTDQNATVGETHYLDKFGIMDGDTTVWSLPSGGGAQALAGETDAAATVSAALVVTHPLAVSSAGTSTASAAVVGAHPLSAATSGASTVVGSVGAARLLAATSTGTATTTGALTVALTVAGTSAASGSTSASLLDADSLAGGADGTSTATATASGARPLVGAAGGSSTVTGPVVVTHPLAVSSAGTSSAAATTTVVRPLAGAADGTSTTTADADAAHPLAGTTSGTTDVTAAPFDLALPLAGTADGVCTAVGSIAEADSLAGTADGASTGAGELLVVYALEGEAAGVAAVTGDVAAAHPLAGTTSGTSSASGALAGTVTFAGTFAGHSATAANLAVTHPLASASAGNSTTSGSLTVGATVSLAGTTIAAGSIGATLFVRIPLVGHSAGTATAGTATCIVARRLAGTSGGHSTLAVYTLPVDRSLDGRAAGTSTLSHSDLAVFRLFTGHTDGVSTAGVIEFDVFNAPYLITPAFAPGGTGRDNAVAAPSKTRATPTSNGHGAAAADPSSTTAPVADDGRALVEVR